MKVTLYKKDVSDEIRIWTIEKISSCEISMTYGLIGGEQQTKYETIETNQSGRTISEQMLSRMSSRVSKQRDKGYVDKYDVAVNNKSTNTLNLPKPMLAQPIKNVVVPVSYYVQNKYDGNRCLITKQNGKVFAYSRNGKIIGSIDHILSEVKDIPERRILDGELYCHGVALQTIRSWISRSQEESKKLIYICYDIMSSDIYSKRLEALKKLNLNPPIYIAETTLISPKESLEYDIFSGLKEAISRGYEGLILRNPDTPYEDGKRSKGLIKVKAFDDGEFKVIDVIPSADGWGILVCVTDEGKMFRVSAPGSIQQKTKILDEKEKYFGKRITVEYANLTKSGIPFHPVAIAFRDAWD